MDIIAAWQNSSRAPTPEARAQLIEKALALAVRANPWPFREPSRESLLSQMWGQLGNEYRRIEGAARPDALERAVAAYVKALEQLGARRDADFARVQYGLGLALIDRVRGERADNVEQAIVALNAAHAVTVERRMLSHTASILVSLSKAYWHRIRGSRADNLEHALAYAQTAAGAFSTERGSSDWLSAQQALGAAYWGRIRGSRADNIEKAIAAYEAGLAAVTRERSPVIWAGLKDNIGMAYAERPRGDTAANMKAAASAFEEAAQVFTRERHPAEWAQLKMNLANVLSEGEIGNPREAREAAIRHYLDALTVYTPDRFPERRARVLSNLGLTLLHRHVGTRAENIEQAITALQGALSYYTRERDPWRWATTQHGLGKALSERLRGQRSASLAAAAAAHDAALSVFTPRAYPLLHMRAALQAGEVAAARGDWARSESHWASAMASSATLFDSGLNRAEARAIVREGPRLFASAAYAAARRNAPQEALEVLERGKARLLRISLGLDALEVTPAERQRIVELRNEIRDVEHRLEIGEVAERMQELDRLGELRSALERRVAAAEAASGTRPQRAMELATGLLAHRAAILLPIVTVNGGALLLVTRSPAGARVEALQIGGLDQAAIDRLMIGADPTGKVGGWTAGYLINTLPAEQQAARRGEWLAAISAAQGELWRLVGAEIARALSERGIGDGAAVLIVPHGALGLLPMATAEQAGQPPLIERITPVFAPSLAAAAAAQRRSVATPPEPRLAAIVNPTRDLQFTEPEGAAAASYFDPARRHALDANGARLAAVLAALPQASHWHFATHANFLPAAPRTSSLLLADDERLTVGELVESTGLGTPRLVVLSACETGLYDQSTPDEFIGLPAAFLQAGAAGVIATLWFVDDASTALVMMKFYELAFAGKASPPVALRQAQLWLRDASRRELLAFLADSERRGRITPAHKQLLQSAIPTRAGDEAPFRHPFYWAAFQYYGA